MRSLLVAIALVACSSALAQSGATPLRTNKAVRTTNGAKHTTVTQLGTITEAKGIRPRPVPPPPPPMMGLKAQWMD